MKSRFILKYILLCSFIACSDVDIDESPIDNYTALKDSLSSEDLSSRVFLSTDANLNPDWDWTTPADQTLYATDTGLACGNCSYPNIKMPFFSGGYLDVAPLNKDMHKEDGWVLVSRDFGTSNSDPVNGFPFLILYNKYRGLLRFSYYKAFSYSYTHYLVNLRFQNISAAGKLFAFTSTDITTATTDTSSSNQSISIFQKIDAGSDWETVDFYLGYVPNLSTAAILEFQIIGVNETATLANGNATANSAAQIRNTDFSAVIDLFKNTASFLEYLEKFANPKLDNFSLASYASGVNSLSSSPGLAKFFIGGKTKETQSIPLYTGGTFNEPSISAQLQPLQTIRLNVDQSAWANDGSAYKPLNPISFGLLSVKTKPKVYAVSATIKEASEQYPGECEYYHSVSYATETDLRNSIDLDPFSGTTITSIQVAVPKNIKNNFYSSSSNYVDIGREFTSTAFSNGSQSPSLTGLFNKREISLRINIKTNSATRNMDNEYVIYKTVPFDLVLGNQTYSDQCN